MNIFYLISLFLFPTLGWFSYPDYSEEYEVTNYTFTPVSIFEQSDISSIKSFSIPCDIVKNSDMYNNTNGECSLGSYCKNTFMGLCTQGGNNVVGYKKYTMCNVNFTINYKNITFIKKTNELIKCDTVIKPGKFIFPHPPYYKIILVIGSIIFFWW